MSRGGGGCVRAFLAHTARSTTSTWTYLLRAWGFLELGGGWRPFFFETVFLFNWRVVWYDCSHCFVSCVVFRKPASTVSPPMFVKNTTRPTGTSRCVTTNTVHVFPARQTQMQSNDLLREILGVSKWGGTGGEKTFYSKNSEVRKQQTTDRTRSRHSKQIAQDHILGGGDERR